MCPQQRHRYVPWALLPSALLSRSKDMETGREPLITPMNVQTLCSSAGKAGPAGDRGLEPEPPGHLCVPCPCVLTSPTSALPCVVSVAMSPSHSNSE